VEYRTIAYRGTSGLYINRSEIGLIPGLAGFNLEFTNSDHHINSLIVGSVASDGTTSDYDSYLLGFSDNDHASLLGDADPTNMWAKYFSIGAGPTFSARGAGIGNQTIAVPTVATGADDILVLRGFAIRAASGSNHNLRRLAIRHNSAGNSLSVSFHDDSASDDEFTFSVLYTIVRRANTSGIRADYYFTGPFAQDFEFTNTAMVNKDLPGFSLLSGFDFRFNDSDHHIRKVAIDPISNEQYNVTFTDDERDNPVSGWIEYVNVHE
jgi:hypothetical protein